MTTKAQQVTEVSQVIEKQQVVTEGTQITEKQQTTEGQQVTTKMQQVTERQQVTTEAPQVTERQQTTELNECKTSQEITNQNSQKLSLELIIAVKESNLDKVKEYINKGADVNTRDYYHWHENTILHWAAKKGFVGIAKFLLDKCANVNFRNTFDDTPLHLAAENGHLDIVKSLVEKGANVNAKRRHGLTPLHFAAKNDHLDVVKYLVDEKGADFNVKDNDGMTPLHVAASGGHLDIVKYLIGEGVDVNAENKVRNTPLHMTAWRGHLDTVKYLVEKGADINAKNKYNETPLGLAGTHDVVKYLQGLGASRSRRSVTGNQQGKLSLLINDRVMNWIKGSTESPALLTSKERSTNHDNTITFAPEINATVINNALLLGMFAASVFNKTQSKQQPTQENLLSPAQQSMLKNGVDEYAIKKAIEEGEKKYGVSPATYIDNVSLHSNETGLQK